MDCPDWGGEDVKERSPAHLQGCRIANRLATEVANRELITSAMIREWHRAMFEMIVPTPEYAGNFRCHDPALPCLGVPAYIGNAHRIVHRGTHFFLVPYEVEQVIEWAHQEIIERELTWHTLSHENQAKWFVAFVSTFLGKINNIHPFVNGNGRSSRVCWRYFCRRYRLDPMCSISDRPKEPYSTHMAAATNGNIWPLAMFMLKRIGDKKLARE